MKNQPKGQSDLPKLAAPAHRALAGAGIQNLNDLTKFSEAEIRELHGIGDSALKELRRAMRAIGFTFAKK
jgi:hypothetical protein